MLKPTGSIWVNLGDKYNSAASGQNGSNPETLRRPRKDRVMERGTTSGAVPQKSLIGLPWRYALRCIDDLGLILRAEVIWGKPNGLPESVKDRVRRSHETWFHLVRSPRYFSAVDTIREVHAEPNGRPTYGRERPPVPGGNRGLHVGRMDHAAHRDMGQSPLGKLPGSVWEIATEPLKVPAHLGVDHFAAFPTELPRRIVLGWSPSGICTACGEGRRPVSESRITADRGGRQFNPASGNIGVLGKERVYAITGEACACPDTSAPTRPSVVLDPFGGTGTAALVAHALGRHGISVDMSGDYSRLAQWRTTDPGELARAMRVEKPPKEADGQACLFDAIIV